MRGEETVTSGVMVCGSDGEGCVEVVVVWRMAVASSKEGATVRSVKGGVTVNSISLLVVAVIRVEGKAMVHMLWDECS